MKSHRTFSISYFALFAIYGVATPYLQILLRNLGYGPAAVGLFLSLFEIVGIVGPLVLARLADGMGRKREALALSAVLILVSLPGLAFRAPAWVTGLALAVFALGLKTLVPVMDSEGISFAQASGRATSYGSMRVMGSLGFMAAALGLQAFPAFAGGPPWAIALALAATTIAFLATMPLLGRREKPSAPDAPVAQAARATRATASAMGETKTRTSHPVEPGPATATGTPKETRRFDPVFALGLVIMALGRFSIAPISSFISIWASEELRFPAVGLVWAIAAASEIPLMLLASRIIPKTGTMGAIAISSLALVARLCIYAFVPTAAGLIIGQLLHSLCFGLFQPAAVGFVAERVPPERRATGMAIYSGLGVGLPAVLGSALGGIVIEAAGYRALFLSFTGFALASLVLFAITRKRFLRA
jgi:PPP family 3-phenylpropionic acid transporter